MKKNLFILFLLVIVAFSQTTPKTISVKGYAEVIADADYGELECIVNVVGTDFDAAIELASQKVQDIRIDLSDIGIDDKDIRVPGMNGKQSKTTGLFKSNNIYKCQHNVYITIRDLEMTSQIIDYLSSMNVTHISQVDYKADNPIELKNRAISDAIDAAEVKARFISEKLELHNFEIFEVNEIHTSIETQRKINNSGLANSIANNAGNLNPGQSELFSKKIKATAIVELKYKVD